MITLHIVWMRDPYKRLNKLPKATQLVHADPGLHCRQSSSRTLALNQPVVPLMICYAVFSKCHIVLKYLWPCCPSFKNSSHLLFNADGLKVWSRDPWGIPKALSGNLQDNYFQSNSKILFVLFTLILPRAFSGAVKNFMTCDITTD